MSLTSNGQAGGMPGMTDMSMTMVRVDKKPKATAEVEVESSSIGTLKLNDLQSKSTNPSAYTATLVRSLPHPAPIMG